MDKSYQRAVNEKIQSLSETIGRIKELSNIEPVWSEPKYIDSTHKGISGAVGVYRIIYKPTMETMSIGQGNVGNRKDRHLQVFRNDGKDKIAPGGSTSGSVTAQKMYKYDTNLDNWLFSFCDVGEKILASEYENQLQIVEEPEFNNLSMGGNN
tara:strand:+ start:43 stop:501 length:459 start_codon:yes stop_codon:yes gene_type:complete